MHMRQPKFRIIRIYQKCVETLLEMYLQGFPKKDARVPEIQKNSDLLSYDKEGKIMQNIIFQYFSIGRLLWKTLYV